MEEELGEGEEEEEGRRGGGEEGSCFGLILYLWHKINGGMRVCDVIDVEDDGIRKLSEVTQAQRCAMDDT